MKEKKAGMETKELKNNTLEMKNIAESEEDKKERWKGSN